MFSKFKLGSTDFTVMSVHSHTRNRTVPQHSSVHSTDHGGMQTPGENSPKKRHACRSKDCKVSLGKTAAHTHETIDVAAAAAQKQSFPERNTTSIIGQHYPCAHQQHMLTDKLQCRTSRLQKMMRNGSFGLCRCTLLERSCSRNWNCKHGPSINGRKPLLNITELVKL